MGERSVSPLNSPTHDSIFACSNRLSQNGILTIRFDMIFQSGVFNCGWLHHPVTRQLRLRSGSFNHLPLSPRTAVSSHGITPQRGSIGANRGATRRRRAFGDLVTQYLERIDPSLAVTTYTSVADAREHLDDNRVDCLVSDYETDETDSVEFLLEIRDSYPQPPVHSVYRLGKRGGRLGGDFGRDDRLSPEGR